MFTAAFVLYLQLCMGYIYYYVFYMYSCVWYS